MKNTSFLFLIGLSARFAVPVFAGDFDDAAGLPGSRAIAINDSRIRGWAAEVASYQAGADLDERWQDPGKALGPATGGPLDITGLGRGGSITFVWPVPLLNGPGPDIAVFENSFSDRFLELAHLEVSSDGTNWQRFPSISQTPAVVGSFGIMDPTHLSGLAGKYRATFGTGFDFSDLPGNPLVNSEAIRFVRLVDVVGDGSDLDSLGNPIYDPYPTFGSAGFDLDGVAVLGPPPLSFLGASRTGQTITFSWSVEFGKSYRLERLSAPEADRWQTVHEFAADRPRFEHEETASAGAVFRLRQIPPHPQ